MGPDKPDVEGTLEASYTAAAKKDFIKFKFSPPEINTK